MNKKNIKILLVDDEPDILEFMSYNLSNEGYKVYTATNGEEAIEKAKSKSPHLILLDVMMPKMDGIEACENLRKLPKLGEKLIIVFLTARSEDYTQVAGLEAGADDYITKPVKIKVFEREVILDRVWGNEVIVGGRTIDVHIRKLREKIGDQHFKTVKGVGYKYVI
jgi:two-component system alkaline phosphatase synthesis response regulator PhoP